MGKKRLTEIAVREWAQYLREAESATAAASGAATPN